MSDITIIGLGLMGSALARTIHQAGHNTTVWNRSPSKMQPFIDCDIAAAPEDISAIEAGQIILVCIDNYDATRSLTSTEKMAPLLRG